MRFVKGGYAVVIDDHVFSVAESELAASGQKETGGILIGTYTRDLSTAIVSQITGPGSKSKRCRFSFKRGVIDLQLVLDKAQNKGYYYLGEWHSHPHGESSPSRQDIKQMRKISKSADYNCPEPVLLIVGAPTNKERYSVHVFNEDTCTRLERVSKND